MTGKIQIEPTSEVQKCANVLEETISRFLRIRDETVTSWGGYEAEVESMVLIGLVIRQIESICVLAKTDLVLLPGALTLSRSVFETSTRILWLLFPDDPFEREVRWLAHLKNDERYYEGVIKRLNLLKEVGDVTDLIDSLGNQLSTSQKFRLEVESVLPAAYNPIKALPNFELMLDSLNQSSQYIRYIELSQFSHGTHKAGRLNRKNFGTEMVLGEFGDFRDWWFVFDTCFNSFFLSSARFLEVVSGDVKSYIEKDWLYSATKIIKELDIDKPLSD